VYDSVQAASGGDEGLMLVDAHMHLISRQTVEAYAADRGLGFEEMRRILRGGPKRPGAAKHNISGENEVPDCTPEAMAGRWLQMLDSAGVAAGVFMSFTPGCQYTEEVVRHSQGRLFALTSVDPTKTGAAALVRKDLAAGYKGIKLYPVVREFHVNDPAAREVYEAAREYGVPVVIHFGFSTDPTADLAYGNPIDLNSVARDFRDVTFVVAHFGAGYFREVLALGYQLQNVMVDTSGTNNWTRYMPYDLTLQDVFARSFEAFGAERIIFGTDSGGGPAGYRNHVLETQLEVLRALGLQDQETELVLWGNACRVMKLEIPSTRQ